MTNDIAGKLGVAKGEMLRETLEILLDLTKVIEMADRINVLRKGVNAERFKPKDIS